MKRDYLFLLNIHNLSVEKVWLPKLKNGYVILVYAGVKAVLIIGYL